MKKYKMAAAMLPVLLMGCSGMEMKNTTEDPGVQVVELDLTDKNAVGNPQTGTEEALLNGTEDLPADSETTAMEEPSENTDILVFRDAFGEEYETAILQNIPKTVCDNSRFVHEGDRLYYEDENYHSAIGIDISKYQGEIDWEKVRADGIEFVFIRIGYRGDGEAGKLMADEMFDANIRDAQAQGLDVGVYLFSQAINEEEAVEEAHFVIDHLQGYELQLPVVYDPETIRNDKARSDDVTGEQFTKNTIAFCEAVKEAGYQPMVYSNMVWEAFQFQMEELTEYPFWYADYEDLPQTPYRYEYWQYSEKGQVDGISGTVDMNLRLIPGEGEASEP